MKKFVLFCLVLGFTLITKAQVTNVTIQDLQFVPPATLANCEDTTTYLGDTVAVTGTVIMNGGLAYTASGRQVWIQTSDGPFMAIGARASNPVQTATKMTDLFAGDSVRLTGRVERFRRETQINPTSVELLDVGRPVKARQISVGDLNDAAQVNDLTTGEQWEGQYVEIVNVTVSSVGDPFANNRQVFVVEDANGNKVTIGDRFPAGRSVNADGTNANNDQGELVTPPVGAKFDTIRGVVSHTLPNGCASMGQNPENGYEIYPFQSSDLVIGASGPLISNLNQNPLVPASTADVNISATIVDPDGQVVSAFINFAVGLSNNSYQQVAMTQNAGTNTYTGQIPATAFSDGDYVKYYISATDDSTVTTNSPSAAQNDPVLFRVRDGGATIFDIQFNPIGRNSLLEGADVTVDGVVTASAQAGDLGFVYIQQPGENDWAGIQLTGGSIADLERGDSVRVQGTVDEFFGFTRLSVITVDELGTASMVPEPIVVNADSFATSTRYAESYEGMLVKLQNPMAGKGIYVVNTNPDAPNNNFGEYRVGNSTLSDQGCLVLSGRTDGSRNFSYINDSTWIQNIDTSKVPVCIVSLLDTMESLTGIMIFTFGDFKLVPRNTADAEDFSGANCPEGVTITNVDLPEIKEFKVYPNPASQQLTIEHAAEQALPLEIKLIDLTGRQLMRENVEGLAGKTSLDLSNLNNGLYLLQVSSEGQTLLTHKVMVRK